MIGVLKSVEVMCGGAGDYRLEIFVFSGGGLQAQCCVKETRG